MSSAVGRGPADRRRLPDWLRYCRAFLRDVQAAKRAEYIETRDRLAEHWALLDQHAWSPLARAVAEDARSERKFLGRWGDPDNAGALCALVLETAVRTKTDGDRLSFVREGATRLRAIEVELNERLRVAAALLLERRELMDAGLRCDPSMVDSDIENLLNGAAGDYPRWASVVGRDLDAFVAISRGTTQGGPDLADILDWAARPRYLAQARGVEVGTGHAGEAQALRPNPGGAPPAAAAVVRRFMATLCEHVGMPAPWLGATAVAHLLSVVFEGKPTSGRVSKEASVRFNVAVVEKARTEYLKGVVNGSRTTNDLSRIVG